MFMTFSIPVPGLSFYISACINAEGGVGDIGSAAGLVGVS